MARLGAVARGWAPTVIFNAVLPYLTYATLAGHGWSVVGALAVSAGWPAVELLGVFAIRRRVEPIGILTLVMLALGVLASVVLHSDRLALVKESATTGLFGLVLLGSLLLPRPLMFHFGRTFATDGSSDGFAYWDSLWQYPGFRRTQRMITAVWGTAFLVEAAVRLVVASTLPASAAVAVSTVAPYVVTGALVLWTVNYVKRSRARNVQHRGIDPNEHAPRPFPAGP